MTSDRESRARDYHREVDDGSTWDLLSEEQRDCYRQAADRLFSAWGMEPIIPTPQMIAAAWAVVRDRWPGHPHLLGPGPAFREAIQAALAAKTAPLQRSLSPDEQRLMAKALRAGTKHVADIPTPLPDSRSENTGGRDGR